MKVPYTGVVPLMFSETHASFHGPAVPPFMYDNMKRIFFLSSLYVAAFSSRYVLQSIKNSLSFFLSPSKVAGGLNLISLESAMSSSIWIGVGSGVGIGMGVDGWLGPGSLLWGLGVANFVCLPTLGVGVFCPSSSSSGSFAENLPGCEVKILAPCWITEEVLYQLDLLLGLLALSVTDHV